jgi:hypothetical protein
MLGKLTLLAAVLVMLLVTTAAVAQTMTEPGNKDELRCFLPEGCDTDGDDVPDLRAGEPVQGAGVGTLQYDNKTP